MSLRARSLQRHMLALLDNVLFDELRFRVLLTTVFVVIFEVSFYFSMGASTVVGDFLVRLSRLMAAPG